MPSQHKPSPPQRAAQFVSVWDAIESSPLDAERMKRLSAAMRELQQLLDRAPLTQIQTAQLLGISPQRVADLQKGRINLFDAVELTNMASIIRGHLA